MPLLVVDETGSVAIAIIDFESVAFFFSYLILLISVWMLLSVLHGLYWGLKMSCNSLNFVFLILQSAAVIIRNFQRGPIK